MNDLAIAHHVPARRADPRSVPPRRPLAGPLVAVCGLCGGAGTSTLAYLIARAEARETRAPVLVADVGGPSAGLVAYAGAQPTRSLPRIANAVAAHEPLSDALFAHAADGLRVMASEPSLEPHEDVDPHALARVLGDARAAHALTVVDCGLAAGAVAQQTLTLASHVVWVLPATLGGICRGGPLLGLHGLAPARRELVVAREDASGCPAPTDELRRLAELRDAPLVLMPHVSDLGEQAAEPALEHAALTLDAIRMELRR